MLHSYRTNASGTRLATALIELLDALTLHVLLLHPLCSPCPVEVAAAKSLGSHVPHCLPFDVLDTVLNVGLRPDVGALEPVEERIVHSQAEHLRPLRMLSNGGGTMQRLPHVARREAVCCRSKSSRPAATALISWPSCPAQSSCSIAGTAL